MTKPNVLFIITDQQRADSMGCYGNPAGTTPHLDALAAESMIFDEAYCESPICMPSRVSLLTGRYAAHHGVRFHNNNIAEQEQTLAHVFTDAGYYTHCIGKMHLYSQEKSGNPESLPDWKAGKWRDFKGPFCGFQGCELILGHSNSLCGHYGMWLKEKHPAAVEAFWTDKMQPLGDRKIFGMSNAFRTGIPEEAHSSAYVAEKCGEVFERAQEKQQPFFCYASFPDPHWPVCPPHEWLDKFADVKLPQRIPYVGECEQDDYPMQYKELVRGNRYYDGGCRFIGDEHAEDMEKIRRGYHAAVAFVDHNVGKIIEDLKQRGLYENTIIVYTTDHGEYLGDHGLHAKGGFMYDSFIRCPLIIHDPRSEFHGRSAAPFSFIDMPATLCDLAEIDNPLPHDGISQSAHIRKGDKSARTHCTVTHFANSDAAEAPHDQHAIVYQEWKLVFSAVDPHGILFNRKTDPQELCNLWHDSSSQSVKQELMQRLFSDLSGRHDRSAIRDKRAIEPGYYMHLMERDFWADV